MVTVEISENLHAELKMRAVSERVPLKELVDMLLRHSLTQEKPKKKVKNA